MLKLRADDPLRRQTESVSIKPQRSLQIVNAESNDGDSWLHGYISALFWRIEDKKCETGYDSVTKVPAFMGGPQHAAR
jgi:hypothetical protein